MTEKRDKMSSKQLVATKKKQKNNKLQQQKVQKVILSKEDRSKTVQKPKFSCKICQITLSSEKYYNRHLRTRHPENSKIFTCDYDGKQFRLKNCLRIHLERHRTSDFLTCDVCQKTYVCRITFKRHLRTHIDKFTCDLCGSTFKNKNIFDRHRISVHEIGDLQFPCKLCSRTFPSSVLRNNHQYLAHKDNKLNLFRCHECNIDFEMKEELRIHSFIHFNGNIHTCLECHQIFKKKSLLTVHMQKHDGIKYNCTECGDSFVYRTGLEKHLRKNRCKGPINKIADVMNPKEVEQIARKQLETVLNKKIDLIQPVADSPQKGSFDKPENEEIHCEDSTNNESNCIENDSEPELTSEKKTARSRNRKASTIHNSTNASKFPIHTEYICDFCGLIFKFKKPMFKHMKEHHVNNNFSKKYQCEHCSETYQNRKKLKDHYLSIHGLKVESVTSKYVCEIDGRTFDTLCFYKNHLLSHSEQNRNHVCQHCSAAFKTVGNLRRHEATHAGTRNFVCSMCSKKFKTKLALKIHKDTIHVDTKVFVKCKICGTILQEKHLKIHMKNQHSEDAQVKRFQCGVCGCKFKTEYIAKRHYKKSHEASSQSVEYVCSECPDVKFYNSQDLRDHSFAHFTGRVFECGECGKKFKTKRCLVAHQQSHANDTFPCGICENISFKTKGGLRKHNNRCHGFKTSFSVTDN